MYHTFFFFNSALVTQAKHLSSCVGHDRNFWHLIKPAKAIDTMQFFPRFHDQEDDVVLGVYQRRDQQPQSKKWLNPWTLMGLGSAVIATTIIIVAMSTSATVQAIHKPDVSSNSVKEYSTSYKSGARKTSYSTLGEDEHKSLFEAFKVEQGRQV